PAYPRCFTRDVRGVGLPQPTRRYGRRGDRDSIAVMNSGRERVERRLAAIMAADVAGYSRLMGEDEEGTHAALTGAAARSVGPQDWRASRPHRQNQRRRAAGRIRGRRRCGVLPGGVRAREEVT